MADNITALANTGSGTDVLATDEIAGVHYPRSKVGFGVDGAYVDVSATNKLPVDPGLTATMPDQNTPALPVRTAPQKMLDVSFAEVGSGLLNPAFTLLKTGAGQTVNQTAGNLVMTAGTTASSETVIRSVATFSGALTFKQVTQLSQRLAANNFYIELVDVLGDGLAYTIVNSSTVDVTLTAHGFTTQNVGQRIDLCNLSSVGVPMDGVIASLPDANTIRFTVSAWPASGSGTLSLTGYNKFEMIYTSTSATAMTVNTRRKGWQNAAQTPAINSSATGHMAMFAIENGQAAFNDKAYLTATTGVATRVTFETNIPQPDVEMYIQIRSKNGVASPATSTTWTVGMIRVEDYIPLQVSLSSVRPQSINQPLPVSGAVNVSGTVTANVSSATVQPLAPATPYFVNSAATTNGALVITGTSGLQALYATNTGASAAFVKLYNKATAPTVGTDVPEMVIYLPAAAGGVPGVATLPVGFSGFRFLLGLGIAITRNVADSDTTAIGAGEVKVKLTRTT